MEVQKAKGSEIDNTMTIECTYDMFPSVVKQVEAIVKSRPVKIVINNPPPIELNYYCTPSTLPLLQEYCNVPGFKYSVAVVKSPDQCERCTLALRIESDGAPQCGCKGFGRRQMNFAKRIAAKITTEVVTETRTFKRTIIDLVPLPSGNGCKVNKTKRKRDDDDDDEEDFNGKIGNKVAKI